MGEQRPRTPTSARGSTFGPLWGKNSLHPSVPCAPNTELQNPSTQKGLSSECILHFQTCTGEEGRHSSTRETGEKLQHLRSRAGDPNMLLMLAITLSIQKLVSFC